MSAYKPQITGYKLQENEIQFTLPTPTPDSDIYISCILSIPEKSTHPETHRAAMLMHGIGGQKNYCYLSKLARKLAKEQGMYAVRFDFRNCGDSSKTGAAGRTLQNDIEDMNVVYDWLTSGGYKGKKLYVDSLIGHSRGVVDVFNWQLQNQDKYVTNLIACAGRFIGSGLPDSIRKAHPNFEGEGGHYIQGFQDGAYRDVWVPLKETQSLGELDMITVKEITPDTDTLCVYGTREQIIPLPDAALYVNALAGRNTLFLIPDADHCYRGVVKIPESEWETCGRPVIKSTGFIDYNGEVADLVAGWMTIERMSERFYEKTKNIHKYLPRWKNVDGVANFRDIGGYNTTDGNVVKYNFIYRSHSLDGITADGVSELKKLDVAKIFRFGLGSKPSTVGDLETTPLLEGFPANTTTTPDVFETFLEKYVPQCKAFFDHLLRGSDAPVLLESGVSDVNTAVVVILLLLLCKVDPLIVAQEYALTKDADSNTALDAIRVIEEKYGGAGEYMVSRVGLSEADIAGIRGGLLV